MELKTTRELKDKVFVLYKDKIQHLIIGQIMVSVGSILVGGDEKIEFFHLTDSDGNYCCNVKADKCFNTKEELINSLNK